MQNSKSNKTFKVELENPFKRMFNDKLKTVIDDPMVKLGFGICAYRDIIWRMLLIFSLFSLMLIPQGYSFWHGEAYVKLSSNQIYN